MEDIDAPPPGIAETGGGAAAGIEDIAGGKVPVGIPAPVGMAEIPAGGYAMVGIEDIAGGMAPVGIVPILGATPTPGPINLGIAPTPTPDTRPPTARFRRWVSKAIANACRLD